MPLLVTRMRFSTSVPSLCKHEVTIVHLFTYYCKWASLFLYVTVHLSEKANLSDNFSCCIALMFCSCILFDYYLSFDLTRWLMFRCVELWFAVDSAVRHQTSWLHRVSVAQQTFYWWKTVPFMSWSGIPQGIRLIMFSFPFLAVRKLHSFWFWVLPVFKSSSYLRFF